jgi:uncharacterized membrane protein
LGTPNPSTLVTFIAISSILGLISIPVTLLIIVLDVNICGVFVKVFYGQPITATEPWSAVKDNFGRKLGGMLWQTLWIFLWSLPFAVAAVIISFITFFTLVFSAVNRDLSINGVYFVILAVLSILPVIIKILSYSMTPYILACNRNVTAINALNLSKRMTKGHKGKIFVMGLSFFGWYLLSALTFGILGILYVIPYSYTAFAGLFVELRNQSVVSGAIGHAELDGYVQQHAYQPQYAPAQQYPQQPQNPYAQQPPPAPPQTDEQQNPYSVQNPYPPPPPPQPPPSQEG